VNNNIILGLYKLAICHKRESYLPINWSDKVVLVGQLQGIDDTKDFFRVTTGGSRVIDDSTDDLLGIDEENGADGQCHAL